MTLNAQASTNPVIVDIELHVSFVLRVLQSSLATLARIAGKAREARHVGLTPDSALDVATSRDLPRRANARLRTAGIATAATSRG